MSRGICSNEILRCTEDSRVKAWLKDVLLERIVDIFLGERNRRGSEMYCLDILRICS